VADHFGRGSGLRLWSGEFEWVDGLAPAIPAASTSRPAFDGARLLVRVRGIPVGFVQVPLRDGALELATVLDAVRAELGARVAVAEQDSSPASDQRDVPVTVCVCTRNRPAQIARCLESLQTLDHRALELLIVDNAPDDDATMTVLDEFKTRDARVRYVREPRPGLSCARNRALREATGEVIAFTDDDVRVDRGWVGGLLGGFGRSSTVGCVTGLVASASLEQPAEQFFDARVSWSSSCEQRLYDPRQRQSPLFPYASGRFGTGANMAFRVADLRRLGGFDESLGAGSPTGGGEDLDIFVRILRAGLSLSYEPAALVWHDHRVDEAELAHQMYSYGKGLAAYLCKLLVSRRTAPDLLARAPLGAWYYAKLLRRSTHDSSPEFDRSPELEHLAPQLRRAEWRGLCAGGPAYLRARRAQTRAHVRAVAP
jgi:glycosyltransferase involved in cell wall biosynthesis